MYLETLTSLLDKGHNINVFYLDFSKTFNSVPHQCPLAKLKAHGITGQIFYLIQSWLNRRKQCAVLNRSQSEWTLVPSGVPQCSGLGSLLFIIFNNDIDNAVDVVSCCLLKYGYDTKGLRRVNTPNNNLKHQTDLDNLCLWSVDWQMSFNLDKCCVLHFCKTNRLHQYFINGHPLLHLWAKRI